MSVLNRIVKMLGTGQELTARQMQREMKGSMSTINSALAVLHKRGQAHYPRWARTVPTNNLIKVWKSGKGVNAPRPSADSMVEIATAPTFVNVHRDPLVAAIFGEYQKGESSETD
jgi:hypothetical protein